jgi:uncharacterized protein (DUF2384 family)
MKFRKANTERLTPDSARRQGNITRLALTLLGRETAMDFLNSENATLGARPLDLAIASESGCASVEAELGRMTCRQPGDS